MLGVDELEALEIVPLSANASAQRCSLRVEYDGKVIDATGGSPEVVEALFKLGMTFHLKQTRRPPRPITRIRRQRRRPAR